MRSIVFLSIGMLVAAQSLLAAETKSYYLTKHQWNHLVDTTLSASNSAVMGEEANLVESASVIGSRLTDIGMKVEKVSLVNRWEMEVTADETEHQRLAKVLEFFDQEIYVYITSKVFDLPSEDLAKLEELGMDAKLKPALFPIKSEQEFETLISQINSHTRMDLLSAPSVVARSGEKARIDVGQDFVYPSDYDPPKFADGTAVDTTLPEEGKTPKGKVVNTFPVTPASPNSFETRRTGIAIDFLPILELDGSVRLQLHAENVNLEGFVNYGSPIMTQSKGGLFKQKVVEVTLTENRMEMPVFNSVAYQGQVDIADETHFILGGLSHTERQVVEDKKLFGKKTSTLWVHRPTFFVVSAKLVRDDGTEVDAKEIAMLQE